MTISNTNQYNQPTDPSGHVLKASEIVAGDLGAVISEFPKSDLEYHLPEIIKALTDWHMQKINDNWYDAYKQGIVAGRKDVLNAVLSSQDLKELKQWASGQDDVR